MATYLGDQLGADLTIVDGDHVYGVVYNVGRLYVPSAAWFYVNLYNGTDRGQAEIHCRDCYIAGTFSANAAGYYGYESGGGGPGGETKSHGGYTGGRGGGRDGAAAASPSGTAQCDCTGLGCGGASGPAGVDAGFIGNGPYPGTGGAPGAGGSNGSPGGPGGKGGYGANDLNGDMTTDKTIRMGSGGGAGAGAGGCGGATGTCNGCGGGGAPGGASGGRGGGLVAIYATNSMRVPGNIFTKGGLGLNGTAGNGWYDSRHGRPGAAGANRTDGQSTGLGGAAVMGANPSCGYGSTRYTGRGGDSGPGAGGGTLLCCTGPYGIVVDGVIDTRGGGDDVVNFGSLKVFGPRGRVTITGSIYAGHNSVYGAPLNSQTEVFQHVCC